MKNFSIAGFIVLACFFIFISCGGGGGGNEGSNVNGDIPNYLCFTASNGACSIWLDLGQDVIFDPYHDYKPPILEYSYDGKKWNNGSNIYLEKTGDKAYLRGNNNTISFSDEWYSFRITGSCKVSGNIMSLLDKSLKLKTIPSDYCFKFLFSGCNITSAPELPATILTNYCYWGMFNGCSNLVNPPALPALTLAESCYYGMFTYCSNLISAPELPATVLVDFCYDSMFFGCTSLTDVPVLPSAFMARYCYAAMFSGCTSLTTTPELSAMNLAEGCYSNMFSSCTGLASSPVLPATELKDYCYEFMFFKCERLKSITVGFSDWNGATDSTRRWVENVDDSGTFKCPTGLANETGVDKIPTGWTKLDL